MLFKVVAIDWRTKIFLSFSNFFVQVLAIVVCRLFCVLCVPWLVEYLAVLRGAFLLLSTVSLELLLSSAKSGLGSPVEHLRPLLTLENPNDQYLFLACLECVEPAIWSGNSPGVPAVLEAWEVERVLHLLESTDPLIWRTVSICWHLYDDACSENV